jgi:prolyl oligopeptidase
MFMNLSKIKNVAPVFLLMLGAGFPLLQAQEMKYPITPKVDQKDAYFGKDVSDPYRWLENDRSQETQEWVKKENIFTNDYLAKIPFREDIRKELNDIWNYEKISAPFKKGNYTYFYKNDGLQAQSVLYRTDKNGKTEVFLDPNKFSEKGTTSMSGISFNKKGTLVGYSISEGGSDWQKIIIMEVETKKIIDEPIVMKFSGASWLGDEGFYYSTYDQPKEGSILSGITDMQKVYFHKLGTKQSEDKLVIGGQDFKRRYMGVGVSDDQRFLILSASETTSGNELYIKDLKTKSDWIPLQKGYASSSSVVDTKGDFLYLMTDKDAPNNKLVKVNIQKPKDWQTVISETKEVLQISTGGGYLFAKYMKDALSFVQQLDYNGNIIREIKLPGNGTASGFGGEDKEKDLYFSYTNYITPPTIYKLNVANGTSQIYQKPKVKFNPEDYVSEQVFYTSKDGTKIPMMISYKKGIKLDGKNPTILYGYGGFNISLTPSFSVVNAVCMDNGGFYAVPNLRGGC